MPTVEVGNRNAEPALAQFGSEQIRAHQQIGAVQRETEADSQQPRRDYGHPGSEIAVMSVDVLHIQRSQLFRHSGTHQGVAERSDAPARRSREFSQHRL